MSFIKKHIQKMKGESKGNSPSSSIDEEPSKEKGIAGVTSNGTPKEKTTNGNGIKSDGIPKRQKTNPWKMIGRRKSTDLSRHSMDGSPVTDTRRQSQELLRGDKERRSMDKERNKIEAIRKVQLARIESATFLENGPEEMTRLYKPLSMNQSKRRTHETRVQFKDLNFAENEGKVICFRARIHTIRRLSAKLVFIVFRQQTITVQGILTVFKPKEEIVDEDYNSGTISERMVRNVEHYPLETIVVVHAKLRKAAQRVKNATIHEHEFDVYEVHKVGNLTENVPFTVYDAENINREKEDFDEERDDTIVDDSPRLSTESSGNTTPRVSTELARIPNLDSKTQLTHGSKQQRSLPQRVRLNNRIIDLRTGPAQAIFRIQSGICNLFRSYLDTQGFIEIHTPKLQGGATESGASVFEANYFGRTAFLAQSPQLAKQMAIAADFERVYEVGPVFRAEDSNTPRHLTEYTGLDLEMALEEHYHEALDIIDGMFKNLWKGIYERYEKEIELISHFYPHEKVLWLEETPRIPFQEGVQMLIDDGWVDDDGNPPSKLEDLATRAEIRLGALVREKYKTDYYILDKFPASARPFYTMPDADDPRYTNSFDIFMRGQEILSGGQRIHDANFLEKNMKNKGMKPESMLEYIEGFRWGAPPHAGCGIGLERLTYLFLSLGNIRLASLFHRDPKSFPEKAVQLTLRHPEASTTSPPWEKSYRELQGENMVMNGTDSPQETQLQPLEKLIANYGDAANTSWLDPRYHVWRHASTGAAQGFIIHNNFAIAVGSPLCAKNQYPQVISAYLQYLKEEHKNTKPIWMIAGPEVEEYVGEKFLWRTLACIAEERANPRDNPASKDKDLDRKLRHAKKEGIKQVSIPWNEPVPDNLKKEIESRIQDWKSNRKGTQIHLTEIRPWVDEQHRRYFYSQGSNGTIHAICILHQLSPQNGYQVKFSLEFPGAPSGTIESLILFSMKSIAASDTEVKSVTFGTGAMPWLEGGRNLGKTKVKALKKAYEAINKQFKLTNKSEFREKMGVTNEPAFVCYPRGGLGAGGIRAIMGFLEEDG